MRAQSFAEFGDRDVLELVELPEPKPARGEVLVRVTAAAINRFDLQVREGVSGLPISVPFVGGMEAVGVVAGLGEGVTDFSPGERVMRDVTDSCGRCRYCRSGREWRCVHGAFTLDSVRGGFADALVCDSRRLVRIPDSVSDVTAAAVQMSYGTAWQMLIARAGLRAGERVLVSSVGSGVGSAALDIAKHAGAFVIGTASSAGKLETARDRGLDVGINYRTTDVAAEVSRLTGGEGVDIAFDHVGGASFITALDSLAMDGRLVSCGWHDGGRVEIDLARLIRSRLQITGSVNRTLDDLTRCLELVAQGALTPAIAATFALEDACQAIALVEDRTAFGKVVLIPTAPVIA
jgi:NADPH:quinone reductase-like Zn-dependent oxidoreductase